MGVVREVPVGEDGRGAVVIDLSRFKEGDTARRAAREWTDGAFLAFAIVSSGLLITPELVG